MCKLHFVLNILDRINHINSLFHLWKSTFEVMVLAFYFNYCFCCMVSPSFYYFLFVYYLIGFYLFLNTQICLDKAYLDFTKVILLTCQHYEVYSKCCQAS